MEGKMFLINAIFQKKEQGTTNSSTMMTTFSESTYRRFSTFPSESKVSLGTFSSVGDVVVVTSSQGWW